MLELMNITKDYQAGDTVVHALRGVSLAFRSSEFVSILGASGSGKTTLLNIIGGLDRYTGGDLVIGNRSTEHFTDDDWDTYRNNCIGFVFQTYNLIPHLTVLGNVELALTLQGVSVEERERRAAEVLARVGLADQLNKRPNQLSGGQMQRVAIARAMVNNPQIILADEPTGALDSTTSEQIMELLKEIAADRLVIMVTHNRELADKYSTRIVRFRDGEMVDDSMPLTQEEREERPQLSFKHSAMNFWTALKLSFKNLMTKKARTIITAVAGSIGIIGVALVLAINNGMNLFIGDSERSTLSSVPISISPTYQEVEAVDIFEQKEDDTLFPEGNVVIPYSWQAEAAKNHQNIITQEYVDYLAAMDETLYHSIRYTYSVTVSMLGRGSDGNAHFFTGNQASFGQLPTNDNYFNDSYDLLAGDYPSSKNEVLLVLDKRNRVRANMLDAMGIDYTLGENMLFEDFIGYTMKAYDNDQVYTYSEELGIYSPVMYYTEDEAAVARLNNLFETQGIQLTVVGVARQKESANTVILSRGIGYTLEFIQEYVALQKQSAVNIAQRESDKNVLTGESFISDSVKTATRNFLGGEGLPIYINIYASSFENKTALLAYLDAWNTDKEEVDKILYTDMAAAYAGTFSQVLDTITLVLICLAGIALVVSTIMISIITYVSVVERTREIGVLRSLGARKKDVARVFFAETSIIGLVAGIIGVVIAYIATFPTSAIIEKYAEVSDIAQMSLWHAIILVVASVALTFLSGIIPSAVAAKKDPVKALRTE